MEELLRKLQKELDILADEGKENMTTYIIAGSNEETRFHSANGNSLDLLTLIADIMKDFFRSPEKLKDAARILYITLMEEAEKSPADLAHQQGDGSL